jgi:hypothetical protein
VTVAMNLIVSLIVVAGLTAVCLFGYFAADRPAAEETAAIDLHPSAELERRAA